METAVITNQRRHRRAGECARARLRTRAAVPAKGCRAPLQRLQRRRADYVNTRHDRGAFPACHAAAGDVQPHAKTERRALGADAPANNSVNTVGAKRVAASEPESPALSPGTN